jgi:hypothetical protein
MRVQLTLFSALLVLAPASAATAMAPLSKDQAAVVGGWSGQGDRIGDSFSGGSPIRGLLLQSVVDAGGCLKLGPDAVVLDNRVDMYDSRVTSLYRLKPGRYAVAGVKWAQAWFDQYDMVGLSRAKGEAWVVDLEPGVVTDIGVWPVTSPYDHRFIPGDAKPGVGSPGASEAVAGAAPLVQAKWSRAQVLDADATCAH